MLYTRWTNIEGSENDNINVIDAYISWMEQVLTNLINTHFPKKIYNVRREEPKWSTPQLKYLSNEKDKAYKSGNLFKFQTLRDSYNKLLQANIKASIKTEFSITDSSQKRWKKIKSLLGIKSKKNTINLANAQNLNTTFALSFNP